MPHYPHRRHNPLNNEWVLVSPHRTQRPWQGAEEPMQPSKQPAHDPSCYLCPRNTRANGEVNPDYTDTLVFANDFSALIPVTNENLASDHNSLFQARAARGACRVICFSKQHNLTLAEMHEPDIGKVISLWITQIKELGQQYRWIQIFENKGSAMGCSNSHPHGQIWASDYLPNEAHREAKNQATYYQLHNQPLLLSYAKQESAKQERIVCENTDWLVVVPYWATWPFETLLLPKFPVTRMPNLLITQQTTLAQILKKLLVKYDGLFSASFPYSMGWHGAPEIAGNHACWQLHAHFYPPLLRSATVRKFMVGYEMLAEAQRDLTAEQAAQRLRDL
ncbi:MAG: galactose-1-phosphate uridylyltransferase [Gammaproteobacteria bacterium RIFCSPHIGHO2_12_FULL_42_13]|nr:MAG: galactose-1-phosphate uridylyltransferase [Gammaproteobacteria bacterium RIFCSPHIGHO2_12_FULL_42_13]